MKRRFLTELEGIPGSIKFTIPCGDDTVTIGYYGCIEEYGCVIQRIQDELDYLNQLYYSELNSFKSLSQDESNDVIFGAMEIKNVTIDEIVIKTNELLSLNLSTEFSKIDVHITEDIPSDDSTLDTSQSIPQNSQVEDRISSRNFASYHSFKCNFATSLAPHEGDGHNRFADGYSWLPDVIQVDFKNNYSEGQNRVALYYEYLSSTDNINNLKYDSDDGVEFEVVFYNYGGTNGSTYIEPYSMDSNVLVWSSNQPSAYLDTQFSFTGSTDELSFCIGVEDTSDLSTNKFYYWTMRNTAGTNNSYKYDGAFKVCAQRTYYYADGLTAFGSHVDGAEDEVTWYRFAEEHEGTLYPKVSQSATVNWCSTSAWTYASNHTEWEFLASSDPVKTTEPNL